MEMMMGKLIVFEGLDGSGKATQSQRLYERLQNEGACVKKIAFPDYGDPSSALVRLYLDGAFGSAPGDVNAYAASSFYAVDRYASFRRYWQEFYEGGGIVIADRYVCSNAIHQMAKLPKDEWDGYLSWLCDYEYQKLGLPKPDLTVYFDMPRAYANELIAKRYAGDESKKDLHEKDLRYMESCMQSARYAADALGFVTVPCVADGALRPIEEIHAIVYDLCREELHR